MLSDFMRKNNPAYTNNPNHVTYPTATPEKATKVERDADPDNIAETDSGRGKRRIASARPSNKKGAINGEIAMPPAVEKNTKGSSKLNGFEEKTFQEAQKTILAEMMSFKDSEWVLDVYNAFSYRLLTVITGGKRCLIRSSIYHLGNSLTILL